MAELEEKETGENRGGVLSVLHRKETLIRLIVIAGIIGIGLIFVSNLMKKQETPEKDSSVQSGISDAVNLAEYREALTNELGSMVASIEGAGRTKLMLTLDGTVRSIYASDEDISDRQSKKSGGSDSTEDGQSSEKRSYIVTRRSDGSEQAVTVGQLMPKVRGVLVVCDGGGDESVRGRIVSAVCAAVNIPSSRVCVSKMGE